MQNIGIDAPARIFRAAQGRLAVLVIAVAILLVVAVSTAGVAGVPELPPTAFHSVCAVGPVVVPCS
ncbi:MAG TPA: hypothetical protein VFM81_06775 [Actinomycetota bacterium]|nr:hypothetical protein [Actinomycetota bacterium]